MTSAFQSLPAARNRPRARIEIVPLIDVIFFLMATFVLVALSMNRLDQVEVVLPDKGDKSKQLIEPVTILVSDQGVFYWDNQPVARDEIPRRLAALAQSEFAPRVLVQGDTKANYGDAISVLDEVRLAGITHVTIQTTVERAGTR